MKTLAICFSLALFCGITSAAPVRFGTPVSSETGVCKKNGKQWQLYRYNNGWFFASGPGGEFIGQDRKRLLIVACREPAIQLALLGSTNSARKTSDDKDKGSQILTNAR